MNITLLFPVLNERLRLQKGIETCLEYARKNIDIPFKLVIVDNGSDDETPEIAKSLEAKYPEVEYRRLEIRGVGIAFKTGIEECTSDIVGYMDIDLSTDLKYLKKTVELFKEKPSLMYVNGSRFSKESNTKGRKWYRKITSAGLVFILKHYLGMKSTDALCGFTFLRTPFAKELVLKCSDDHGWFYTVEMLLRAERMGAEIEEIPVEWVEDYNTTVKVFKTIKNYLIQISKLKKAFREEAKQSKC